MSAADWYLPVRHLHLSAVGFSLTLFAARGAGVLMGAEWPMRPLHRRASVVVDTVLLGAGVTLWTILGLNPWHQTWLGAKLVLLLVYIVLGSFALKRARGRAAKAGFCVAALACVGAMVAIARAHDPSVLTRAIGL